MTRLKKEMLQVLLIAVILSTASGFGILGGIMLWFLELNDVISGLIIFTNGVVFVWTIFSACGVLESKVKEIRDLKK